MSFRSFRKYVLSSTNHIWKSRLSWKIAANVFLTILIVQGAVMFTRINEFEREQLNQITKIAKSSIIPFLEEPGSGPLESPLSRKDTEYLMFAKNYIRGITIYSPNLELIGQYGQIPVTRLLNHGDMDNTFYSADKSFYEIVLKPSMTSRPYILVVRLNSSHVQDNLLRFFRQNLIIIGLLSGLVTIVLMIALGYILLEPILFLSNMLNKAAETPENPDIENHDFDESDELESIIRQTTDMVKQNARNLKQIKSKAEDQIHQLAYFDKLTGLPNRTQFKEVVAEAIKNVDPKKPESITIVAIDLDYFKDINDSMGHTVGDAILKSVAERLKKSLPDNAVIARNDADEFGVLIPHMRQGNTKKDAGEYVWSIIRERPFEVLNEEFQIRASVGVAVFPTHGKDADAVLKNADIALNRAKEDGRDRVQSYTEDFDRAVQQRFQMLRDLSDALENDEIELYYQPQFDLKTGHLIGAEGLLRWWKPNNNKDGGSFISPGEFIPVAEQSGLIVPIGEQVLYRACDFAHYINQTYDKNIRIAVNVSGVQFTQSNLPKVVQGALNQSGLSSRNLELEVTESIFMKDIDHTIQTLKELNALGIELAIDDFGTGYSSLSYLRQFPIDRLKIDQSFIRNALNNADDAAITKTIIALGHSLNLSVIAEGVETKDHERFLVEQNCDEVQGFRYAKPMPPQEFETFIQNYTDDLSAFDS